MHRSSGSFADRSVMRVEALLFAVGILGCTGRSDPNAPSARTLRDYQFERTTARAERGRYLVTIAQCFDCHSPIDSVLLLPLEGKEGSGDIIDSIGPTVAPNITPDIETGAGTWTDDMFVRAIREGFGHDGRPLHSSMRSEYFSILTDEDVASVVVYLRSLPPVRHELPRVVWADGQRGFREEPMIAPAQPGDLDDTLTRGAYLVRIAMCEHCHSPVDSSGKRMAGLRFAGGTIGVEDSAKVIVSKNITQDPTGIPYYDEALFAQTIRTGRVGGVRELNPWMPWPYLRIMTDNDLAAVFRYLQAQPPVRHYVDNSEPPSQCQFCGTTHGLGALN